MFGFLTSRRRKRQSQQPKRHRRIQFESLERRYCLTAPTIASLQIDSFEDTTVSLSGYATDESPETVRVDFEGSLYGSAYPDASGYFTFTGEADCLAEIMAVAFDQEDMESEPAYVELTSDEPAIDSLTVAYGYHTDVAIVGEVIDEDPGGLTVYFSGAVEGTAVTEADGSFMLEITDGSASLGSVEVSVADVWGQEAYDYAEICGDDVPEIVNFTADVSGTGVLTVEGEVLDEDPVGLTVVITFWGNEYEVTTNSDGEFFWQLQLEEGQEDYLTAVAFDWWGLESDAAEDYTGYGFGGY